MKIVAALGGNALSRRGEPITSQNLRKNVREAVEPLAGLALEHDLVLTHGNGPQVGLLALQNLAYEEIAAYPLDILGAETQGMLGYVVGQELMNAVRLKKEMATILTTTAVAGDDPAFDNPTKFVGPVYSEERANELAAEHGWTIAQDGEWWRRVVPSPEPLHIRQAATIRALSEMGLIVLCVGGGGVPVVADYEAGHLRGVEAVIDKDLASAVLAHDIEADLLLLLTDADAVYLDWGTPEQRAIERATPEALAEFGFAAGSMGPKVDAARRFVADGHGEAVIGSLSKLGEILAGTSGTRIVGSGDLRFYS
ncbi:carbamate kinase [Beutenbergia cavernae DSM 12333]|uniref:Carbamate kinase n=1 Tax=Beutenbergia cavernae (strain ATCC BAA-8 / DSM 12333 / CCUG 43141 / JCM 11478 / NBRC 16432 / NCIMB 13614 / HKI 0122) TaxID=471853 RepID=C5BXV2_BEUC1|nr:carbamate kinase [Beutenbergia cavernae]ACQ78846.1 carbamate kinase [Beutenbergia cavernae DSM 12333]